MTGTIRNCLYCGVSIQMQRATRKYCSDTCKQAAFYSRNAQTTITLNGSETLSDDERYDDEIEKELPESTDAIESEFVNQEQSPDRLTFNVSSNVRKCDKPAKLSFNVRNAYSKTVTKDQNKDKRNEDNKIKDTKKEDSIIHANEEAYEWVRSDLLDDIAEYLDDNGKTTQMFQYPNKYWYGSDLEKVKWVSVRFLCIIENLLRFDKSTVERKTMVALNRAFSDMIGTSHFKHLPYNYPFISEIKKQQLRMDKIIKALGKSFRFGLKKESKIKLIALRFQLTDLVSKVKFHDLDFSK